MKKFFFFLAALCCTMGLMATNVHVSDPTTLKQQLGADGVMDTVVVDEDFDVTIVITEKGSKVLDLNGHTLNLQYNIITNGDLTITGNGSLIGVEGMYSALLTINDAGNLTIQNGTFDMSKNAQQVIFVNVQKEDNTDTGSVTINDGLFIGNTSWSIMHIQVASVGTHSGTINGGVFVNYHSYLGPISDSGKNRMTMTYNKCVFVNANPTNKNVAHMYSSSSNYIIPVGKRLVLDGVISNTVADASINGMQAKVCYVGDESYTLFQNFNLVTNNAYANVYGITEGGNAYGHAAHTAVVVTASPKDDYDKVEFSTTPAHDITPLEIATDTYLIMPYVGGESINVTGVKETPTSLGANANVNANVNKRLVNGQLLIQREGRIYNVTGAEVK